MASVLEHILEWSKTDQVPAWQQDALRRLLQTSNLTETDVVELTHLCRNVHGLDPVGGEAVPELKPLSENDCSAPADGVSSVKLTKLHGVKGVNALAEDQTIDFAPDGVTVIYGDNGSGKSGYGRVMRALCGARGTGDDEIRGNVYVQDSPTVECQAELEIDGEAVSVSWSKGQARPKETGSIGIFDSDAAYCYVAEENDAAFMPFGLDLFDRLGKVCLDIEKRLKEEQRQLNQRPNYENLRGNHPVGKFIESINHSTTVEELTELAKFSEDDEKKLEEALGQRAQLRANSPQKRAAELRAQAERFRKVAEALKTLEIGLSDELVSELKTVIAAAHTAALAAAEAEKSLSSPELLPGTGGQVWKLLWDAARRYSQEVAYPEQDFPKTEDGAKCVLCQQDLTEPVAERLESFEQYIKADVQEQLQAANELAAEKRTAVEKLAPETAVEQSSIDELKTVKDDFPEAIQAFLKSAVDRRSAVLATKPDDEEPAPALSLSPRASIEALVAQLLEQAKSHQESDADIELHRLTLLIDELTARKRLAERRDEVKQDIIKQGMAKKVGKCLEDVKTRPVSTKSSQLTEEFVTEELCRHFKGELNQLDRYGFRIALKKARAMRGRVYHRVELLCEGDAPAHEVLSEGEFRCVALSGFLTELSAAPGNPPLIFDDPVSSLDHRWRREVANRLVKESARRQIIVFTHDIVFLLLIQEIAAERKKAACVKHLRRKAGLTGYVRDGAPWDGMKFSDRQKALNTMYTKAAKAEGDGEEETYEAMAKNIYGYLREAWERSVEEILFNGVVTRFGRAVQTNRLKAIAGDITEEDYEVINAGMSRCSTFLYGHDNAPETMEPIPDSKTLRQDLDLLFNWAKAVRVRRN